MKDKKMGDIVILDDMYYADEKPIPFAGELRTWIPWPPLRPERSEIFFGFWSFLHVFKTIDPLLKICVFVFVINLICGV